MFIVSGQRNMKLLDKAQNKLLADFCEKFALAIATAIAAKIFFAEEGLTAMTYCAIAAAVTLLLLSILLAYGTENKPKDEVMRTEVKKGIFHVENAEIRR